MFDEFGITYPGEDCYQSVSQFAQTVYFEKYGAIIEAAPDAFAFAKYNQLIIGCFGLYCAKPGKQFLFEQYVSDAQYRICGQLHDRNKFAELGTKVVRIPRDTEIRSMDVSLLLTAGIIKTAHERGVRFVGFTTNRLVKRVTDVLGFRLIELGAPDISNTDKAFQDNWKEYFRIPQYCYGFQIHSLSQCNQILERTEVEVDLV